MGTYINRFENLGDYLDGEITIPNVSLFNVEKTFSEPIETISFCSSETYESSNAWSPEFRPLIRSNNLWGRYCSPYLDTVVNFYQYNLLPTPCAVLNLGDPYWCEIFDMFNESEYYNYVNYFEEENGFNILDPTKYDCVNSYFGGKWSMPSSKDLEELFNSAIDVEADEGYFLRMYIPCMYEEQFPILIPRGYIMENDYIEDDLIYFWSRYGDEPYLSVFEFGDNRLSLAYAEKANPSTGAQIWPVCRYINDGYR